MNILFNIRLLSFYFITCVFLFHYLMCCNFNDSTFLFWFSDEKRNASASKCSNKSNSKEVRPQQVLLPQPHPLTQLQLRLQLHLPSTTCSLDEVKVTAYTGCIKINVQTSTSPREMKTKTKCKLG